MSSCVNKWQRQYFNDIMCLSEFDEMIWLCDVLQPDLKLLLDDEDARDTFCRFDFKQLSAQEVLHGLHKSSEHETHNNQEFVCGALLGDGSRCMYTCSTHRQLMTHQRRMRAQGHAVPSYVNIDATIVNNVCPFCETVFASKPCAVQHVKAAVKAGVCAVDRGFMPYPASEPEHLACQVCRAQFDTLAQYFQHIATHFVAPIVPAASSLADNVETSYAARCLRPSQGYESGVHKQKRQCQRQRPSCTATSQASRSEIIQRRERRSESPRIVANHQQACAQQQPQLSHVQGYSYHMLENQDRELLGQGSQGSARDLCRESGRSESAGSQPGRVQGAVRDPISVGYESMVHPLGENSERADPEVSRTIRAESGNQGIDPQHEQGEGFSRSQHENLGAAWRMEIGAHGIASLRHRQDVSQHSQARGSFVSDRSYGAEESPGAFVGGSVSQANAHVAQSQELDDAGRSSGDGRHCPSWGSGAQSSAVPRRNGSTKAEVVESGSQPGSGAKRGYTNAPTAMLTIEESHEAFFAGTQFQFLGRQARSKAIAMIDVPKEALLRTCALRRIDASGMRRELIVRICQHHANRSHSQGTKGESKGNHM